jgi:hypothetical protein
LRQGERIAGAMTPSLKTMNGKMVAVRVDDTAKKDQFVLCYRR